MRILHNEVCLATFSFGFFVLALSAPVWGEVGLEQGQSNSFLANPKYFTKSKYSAVTVRYKHLEAIQGSWYGESSGRFLGLSGAYRSSGRTFFDGSLGMVKMLNYEGVQLDGNKQFIFSLGVGRRFGDLSVMVKFRHFSNGNRFKHGSNNLNKGQDFIFLSIAI